MPITPNPDANFTPTMQGYTGQGAFRFWCQTVLPLVYDDSLSYYELLNKVVVYLNNVISDVSAVETNVTELLEAYNELQGYVNDYFSSLDVQEEINNKLDEMAQNGSLSALISPLLPALIAAWLEENITPTTPVVDSSLSIEGAAADSKTVGTAIYKSKDRSYNIPSGVTFWDNALAGFSDSNPVSPADIPINSYLYATGTRLAGFNTDDFTLPANTTYFVWCWCYDKTGYRSVRQYIIYGPKTIYYGRSLNSGETVTWHTHAIEVDPTLSEEGMAADAYITGEGLYGLNSGKSRSVNRPTGLTFWDNYGAGFDDENPVSPADMPINSYLYATSTRLAGFNTDDFTLPANTTYFVWCWCYDKTSANRDIREYIIIGGSSVYYGRTLNAGQTVSWHDMSAEVDATLSVGGGAADALTVGKAIYGNKNRNYNYPIPLTWVNGTSLKNDTTVNPTGDPITPQVFPKNSISYILGSNLNLGIPISTGGTGYWVIKLANSQTTGSTVWTMIVFSYGSSRRELYIGTTTNGSTIYWVNYSNRKTISIACFGDSIMRGITWENGSASHVELDIPEMCSRELQCNVQNFGIGSIGWLNPATNRGTAYDYLKRVGNADYYDPTGSDPTKFLGSGGWSDFNAILLAYGINDNSYPLGDISTDCDDSLTDTQVAALTPTTIIGAMYQCYRYIRQQAPNIQIIISGTLPTKGGTNGVAPTWSYVTEQRLGPTGAKYSTMERLAAYKAFCERYGLSYIDPLDNPINRVDIMQSLPYDGVHPSTECYKYLGRYFAGKLNAVVR